MTAKTDQLLMEQVRLTELIIGRLDRIIENDSMFVMAHRPGAPSGTVEPIPGTYQYQTKQKHEWYNLPEEYQEEIEDQLFKKYERELLERIAMGQKAIISKLVDEKEDFLKKIQTLKKTNNAVAKENIRLLAEKNKLAIQLRDLDNSIPDRYKNSISILKDEIVRLKAELKAERDARNKEWDKE